MLIISDENKLLPVRLVLDYTKLNTLHLRGFQSLDARLDKKWSLDVFLDVQNIFNISNPTAPGFTLQRNTDESIVTTNGQLHIPGIFGNPSAPNNRQLAIPVILANDSSSRSSTIGFTAAF